MKDKPENKSGSKSENKKVTISARVTEKFRDALQVEADEEGVSVSDLIRYDAQKRMDRRKVEKHLAVEQELRGLIRADD